MNGLENNRKEILEREIEKEEEKNCVTKVMIACGNIFQLKSFKCQHLLPINIDNTHTHL